MRFHKGATSQDDSVAKVANSAAQPFLEREFALFLLDDLLGLGRFKCRRVVLGGSSAPAKTGACDTLLLSSFAARGLRQLQNDPDSLMGSSGALGQRLSITAVTIILGVLDTEPLEPG